MPKLEMKEGTPLGKHPNGVWYWRGSIPGLGEKIVSTGETDFKLAVEAGREIERELLKEAENYQPLTYEDIANEAFKVRQDGNRDTTADEARYVYDELIRAFGERPKRRGKGIEKRPIEEVTDSLWLSQLAIWKSDKKRKSFANFRKYAVQIDNYAFRKGYKKFRCDFPIKDPKKRVGRVLTGDEFSTLLHACTNWYRDGKFLRAKVGRDLEQGKRTRLFLIMARCHGMRRSEVIKMPWSQIDLEKRSWVLHPDQTKTGSKTGKGREGGLAPEAVPYLTEAKAEATTPWLFANREGNGPVDKKSINRVVKRLCKATGIDFKPHDLRHSFLTQKICVEKKEPMSVAIYVGAAVQVIQDNYVHAKIDDTRHVVDTGAPVIFPTTGAPALAVVQGGAP